MKTGEIPMWRHGTETILCSGCVSKAGQQKCGCSEIEELKAALEVLARRLEQKADGCPFVHAKSIKCKKESWIGTLDECVQCIVEESKRQARKNLKRRKK